MLHLRVGGLLSFAAISAHASYVWHERVNRAPSNRFLYFSPGSQDAAVADSLRTGDVVLFKRDCSLSAGAAGMCCVARQRSAPGGFDGAGVIVLSSGVPFVLEARPGGGRPRLRRYEARVQSSRAREILVRPLTPPLEPARAAALEDYATNVAGDPNLSTAAGNDNASAFFDAPAIARALGETAALACGLQNANQSVAAVVAAAKATGIAGDAGADAGLAPPTQPWMHTRFASPVWVRDLR